MQTTVGDTSEWPKSFPEIKEFDTLLRCGICYETMETAMMLQQCSHNYCSLCIRKYMTFKTQCPICRAAACDLDLRNNRVLDDLIKQFLSVRSRLLQLVSEVESNGDSEASQCTSNMIDKDEPSVKSNVKKNQQSCDEDGDYVPMKRHHMRILSSSGSAENSDNEFDLTCTPKTTRKNPAVKPKILRTPTTKEKPVCVKQPAEITNNANNSCNISTELRSPTSTQLTLKSPEFKSMYCTTPKPLALRQSTSGSTMGCTSSPSTSALNHPVTPQTPGAANSNKVSCPVCGVSVPGKHINLHLDRCLNSEKSEPRESAAPPKRKRLAKLVHNLLSDKELRKKLSEFKLSTQGDRQTMIKRHQQFTLLYNADCDSLHPKSVEDLVKEVHQGEKTKSQLTFTPVASRSNSLQINKGASTSDVEKAQKQYAKQHKSQFDQLIAETRARMKKAQQKKKHQEEETIKRTDSVETITADEGDSNENIEDIGNQNVNLTFRQDLEGSDNNIFKGICEKQSGHGSPLSNDRVEDDVDDSEGCSVNMGSQSNLNLRETSSCVQLPTTEASNNVLPSLSVDMSESGESSQDLLASSGNVTNSCSLMGSDGASRSRTNSDAASESLAWLSQRCPVGNSESNTRDAFDNLRGSSNFDILGDGEVNFEGLLEETCRGEDNQGANHLSGVDESDCEDMTSPVFHSLPTRTSITGNIGQSSSADSDTLMACLNAEKHPEEARSETLSKEFSKDFGNIPSPESLQGKIENPEEMQELKNSPELSSKEKSNRKRKLRSGSPKAKSVALPIKKSRRESRVSKGEDDVNEREGVSTRRQLRTRKK